MNHKLQIWIHDIGIFFLSWVMVSVYMGHDIMTQLDWTEFIMFAYIFIWSWPWSWFQYAYVTTPWPNLPFWDWHTKHLENLCLKVPAPWNLVHDDTKAKEKRSFRIVSFGYKKVDTHNTTLIAHNFLDQWFWLHPTNLPPHPYFSADAEHPTNRGLTMWWDN